ncbi:hypothetical protein L6452_37223 [Arctium lappa]|uniref:Uncharacterized protein n=1 Tax=Arctium lappa TaxID=4217 RepID=A0ACB8Y2C3_ARCLA|nr:hypothetical protein L6452_37223 [Arctium lappa]
MSYWSSCDQSLVVGSPDKKVGTHSVHHFLLELQRIPEASSVSYRDVEADHHQSYEALPVHCNYRFNEVVEIRVWLSELFTSFGSQDRVLPATIAPKKKLHINLVHLLFYLRRRKRSTTANQKSIVIPNVSNNNNTPLLAKDEAPISSDFADSPRIVNGFHPKGVEQADYILLRVEESLRVSNLFFDNRSDKKFGPEDRQVVDDVGAFIFSRSGLVERMVASAGWQPKNASMIASLVASICQQS